MPKVTMMGAGSTVFSKSVLGDCMASDDIEDLEIALYDIDPDRLEESARMLTNINETINSGCASISSYLGEQNRREALKDAGYVVNAIQVGGYEPSTVVDFEVPKKYGLRQTIADTLGIGGIFRALRTIPVLMDFAEDMEAVCPDALCINYSNPMAMLAGAMLRHTDVSCVGLCHSVQGCAAGLCRKLDLPDDNLKWNIAGINHQAWLLDISRNGEDLYPEIKKRAFDEKYSHKDAVRFELMKHFGYYVTESSEHSAEYVPYFIKSAYPEFIERFHIPLDEYPRRCVDQIKGWEKLRDELVTDKPLEHTRGHEYASYIIEATENDVPYTFGGSVLNTGGLIANLPENACVEIKCVADRAGLHPTRVGRLPEQLAALNRTNINVQIMAIEAAVTGSREALYQAALLDPHTASELPIDDIIAMCDEMIEAHGDFLPQFS